MKDIGQSGVWLQSRESDIQVQDAGLISQLQDMDLEQSEGSMDSRTKTWISEDNDQMSQHFW